MKKVFMLFVALCLTGVVKAQFSESSEVYIYQKVDDTDLMLVQFNSGYCYTYMTTGNWQLKEALKKGETVFDFFMRWKRKKDTLFRKCDYDSSNSTTKRVSYAAYYDNPYVTDHYFHYSFSKDKESLIYWHEDWKNYYHRVDKSEFEPKSQNKDFLYE